MTTARLRPAILAAVLAASAIVIAGPSPAHAQDDATKQACVSAYDETQSSRQKGALRAAREKALACSQEACPAIVKKDCAQWLGELEAALPTVSFAVKDATGQDTTSARVFLDGQLLAERVSANAAQVDPGERTFRVELEGKPPIERKVVIREGEKGRVLEFSFADPADATQPPATDDKDSAGIPVASWVLGGVGVVGLGLFATFGAIGLSEKSDAEDPAGGCAPNCTDDEVSSIRGKFLVADISLGVGIAAIGAAVIVAFASGGGGGEEAARAPAPSFSVGAAPLPGGGFASASGNF
jgi:hypothetical protein